MKISRTSFILLASVISLLTIAIASPVIGQTLPLPAANSIELSTNGGFEAKDEQGKPDLGAWVLTDATKDKIRCNKPGISHTGDCGFRFKGGVGERATLQQEPDLNGMVLQKDGHVIFSGYINWSPATAFKLEMALYDLGEPEKIKLPVPRTFDYGEYIYFAYDFTLVIPVDYVSFTFKHKGKSGKTLLDDISIAYLPPNRS